MLTYDEENHFRVLGDSTAGHMLATASVLENTKKISPFIVSKSFFPAGGGDVIVVGWEGLIEGNACSSEHHEWVPVQSSAALWIPLDTCHDG
jgi:hypothetical protein